MEVNKTIQARLGFDALKNDWFTAFLGGHLHALLGQHVVLDVVRVQVFLEKKLVVLQK